MTDRATYDSWKIKPPCESGLDCNVNCPYFVDCNGCDQDEEDEDEDE